MAISTAACFLCLVVSSALLTLPGPGDCAASDPDDDSWSIRDGVGLAGGDRWAADLGVTNETPAAAATATDDLRDDPTSDDSESDTGYFGSSRGGKGSDSSDFGVGNTDYGVDDSDISSDDSDIGDDDSDIGVDDSDIGIDDNDIGIDDSDIGVDDTDFSIDYSDDDVDFGVDNFDFNGGDYGLGDGSNDFDIGDFDFDDGGYDFVDSGYEFDYGDFGDDYNDIDFDDSDDDYDLSDYESGGSGHGNSDTDYDYEEDSDYGHGDEVGDRFGRSGRRFGRDYEIDDSTGVDDIDGDFDDEFDDFSFGKRSRGGRRSQRRHGGRRGHQNNRVRTRSARKARSVAGAGGDDAGDIEIDDASANPEDIPRGYFDQQEAQGSRTAPATSGSIDFPGFRIVIREANGWWKFNENVCLNKEFLRPTESDEEDTDVAMYTVKCSDYSLTEYSCNVTEWNGTVSASYRLTYTCCRGFTRLRSDRGCPRRVSKGPTNNLSFAALLRKHGYSQKIIDLFGTVLGNDTKKQWTVFVPAIGALDAALRRLNYLESREEPVPEWFVRTVLNHFAQPARPTGSLSSRQVLPTMAKTGGGLLITKTKRGGVLVNCQPIQKANQPFNKYSLVHFTSSMLAIHQSNLYQLMIKRLESVVAIETAKKLLAPIKSMLTGARPATVFMHMPSTEEMENGCFARNLRATIVSGAECNASLTTLDALRTIDGKLLRITKTGRSVVIGGNRVLISMDHLASNGVLHIVNTTESLTGFENVVTRRLKSSDRFRPLFNRPNRSEGSLALLIPPNNGSYSYFNTSARWENATELFIFGRRHMLDNATALMGRSARLTMLDGTQRDFVQLLTRQASASIFGPVMPVRHRFVDCVRIVQTAKDCGGTFYMLLKGELPDFLASPAAHKYLNSSMARRSYSVVRQIVRFALARNVTDLASRLSNGDAALVLLKDADMNSLSGGLLARRRAPTNEQMLKLTTWFAQYFVASKQICAFKSLIPYVSVPVLHFERRRCRTIICAFSKQVSSEMRRIQLRTDSLVTVREGFLLPGKLVS